MLFSELHGLHPGLDSAEVFLAYGRCGPGSITGANVWQSSGRPSKFDDFLRVCQYLPPRMTTKR